MDLPFHSCVIAERAWKNLVPPEKQAIFLADLFYPDHDGIEIGRWAVMVVTPEWRVNADNMGGLEPVNEDNLELRLVPTIYMGSRIISAFFTLHPILTAS